MTKTEYAERIIELYRIANASDTENGEPWIARDACATHCQAYDKILHNLFRDDPEEHDDAMARI